MIPPKKLIGIHIVPLSIICKGVHTDSKLGRKVLTLEGFYSERRLCFLVALVCLFVCRDVLSGLYRL